MSVHISFASWIRVNLMDSIFADKGIEGMWLQFDFFVFWMFIFFCPNDKYNFWGEDTHSTSAHSQLDHQTIGISSV